MIDFIKQMFQGDNGQSSFARITGFIIVLWKLVEGSYEMVQRKVWQLSDLPLNWLGLVFALYGLNKLLTRKDLPNVDTGTAQN